MRKHQDTHRCPRYSFPHRVDHECERLADEQAEAERLGIGPDDMTETEFYRYKNGTQSQRAYD
jgi:hypothetical protein